MKKLSKITKWFVDRGEEGLFMEPLKSVIANILTDNGAGFLFDETVVGFLAVTASGKRDAVILAPDLRGIVDKFRVIIAGKFQDREKG
jgi:hypothetical protein